MTELKDSRVRNGYNLHKVSLFLSSAPYAVCLVMLALMFSSEGYDGLRFLVVVVFTLPFLALVSVVSVILAFLKTSDLRLSHAAKICSIISALIFSMLGAIVILGMISTASFYSGYMP